MGFPEALNWVNFYVNNRNDGGPIQALFGQNLQTMSEITAGHLNKSGALTETIVGPAHGNIMMVPGRTGTIQLIVHQGFGAATDDGFALYLRGAILIITLFMNIIIGFWYKLFIITE